MKTIILAITICAAFALSVKAQNNISTNKVNSIDTVKTINKLKFSLGVEEGIPVGYVSKYSSFVTGGSLQAGYTVVKDLDVTLNVGYLYFLAKDGQKGLSFIPAMAGLRYSFLPKFYLSGQIGGSAYAGKDSDKSMYLTYAQGIGYKATKQIDILVKYEGINTQTSKTYSFAGLRIAYTFEGK